MSRPFVIPTDLPVPERAETAPAPGELVPPHNAVCFGCGTDNSQGLQLRVTAGADMSVSAPWIIPDRFEGGPGVVHGGILTTAFDEIMGMALWLVGKLSVTAHLETDFIAPVPLGEPLTLTGRIVGVVGRKIYGAADLTIDADGSVAARAQSLFIAVDAQKHFGGFIERSGRHQGDFFKTITPGKSGI